MQGGHLPGDDDGGQVRQSSSSHERVKTVEIG
jgi:hypothetical protein